MSGGTDRPDRKLSNILVTGGARSGKSLFAEQLVAETASRKFYLATCPVFDGELAERIARHRQLAGIDAEAGKHAARFEDGERPVEK